MSPIELADGLHGAVPRDHLIAPIATMRFEFTFPSPGEEGRFWSVEFDGYHFEAGFGDGAFYLKRNDHVAHTKRVLGAVERCWLQYTWSPEWLRVSVLAKVRAADGSASAFLDKHELQTPAVIVPNGLIAWARKELLVPVTAYPTERDFRDVVLMAISTLEDTITHTGMQPSFWNTRKGRTRTRRTPKKEVECLPAVHALLMHIAIQKNLEISPEHSSGVGDLDFLISGSLVDHTRVKACIEFKLAHNTRLKHGLSKQLPAYMRANACDFGIYALLYFRCDEFDLPKKDIPELQVELEGWRSAAGLHTVRPIIINCAIPVTASEA